MIRVLVCGGRDFTNAPLLRAVLSRLHSERGFTVLIEGGQRTYDRDKGEVIGGADYWARCWAMLMGVNVETVKADWKTHGKAAGPIRNQRMLDEFEPKLVVAFKGGAGTADMVKRSRKSGLEVIEVASSEDE